jgi:hypothetical protein
VARTFVVVLNAGYDASRIAHLPVEVLGWMRSDRALARPATTQGLKIKFTG